MRGASALIFGRVVLAVAPEQAALRQLINVVERHAIMRVWAVVEGILEIWVSTRRPARETLLCRRRDRPLDDRRRSNRSCDGRTSLRRPCRDVVGKIHGAARPARSVAHGAICRMSRSTIRP
jgi:hypothetical protein